GARLCPAQPGQLQGSWQPRQCCEKDRTLLCRLAGEPRSQQLVRWNTDRTARRPSLVGGHPDGVRDPAGYLLSQSAVGVRLMERIVYDRMAELDERHWWYRARRDILGELIRREISLPAEARILEVGCGTGHNLPRLGACGHVDAIEIDEAARDIASQRLGHPVMNAPLPELNGVRPGTYDLIAMLDVLEHVEADREALVSLASKLRSGGRILITVPAHPWMWRAPDVLNPHHRRYTRRALREVVAAAELKLEMMSWFN